MRQVKPDYVCPSCQAKATIKNRHMGVDHSDQCDRMAEIWDRWPTLSTRILIERS